MRPSSNSPLDPGMQADLDAIDATLRGEAVHPAYAELAEIALLLTDERPPAPREEFVQELDTRVERRFKRDPAAAAAVNRRERTSRRSGRVALLFSRPAVAGPLVALLTLAVIAAIAIPSISGNGAGSSASSGPLIPSTVRSSSSATATSSSSASGASASAGAKTPAKAASGKPPTHLHKIPSRSDAGQFRTRSSTERAQSGNAVNGAGASSSGSTALPAPAGSGRKVEQSTQIQLGTGNGHIEDVSQEVFNVVSEENGIVERSHVSAASGNAGGSYATFTLSIPDANLAAVMDKLSTLQYANVISREQSTQDVTDQYNDDQRALADARTLRSSLLKQLEQAVTTGEIDSLKAQIQAAEATIGTEENRINQLNHATSYSTVAVQINAQNIAPTPVTSSSSGFTVGKGAHDAVRVLVVVAGVALIVLAVLIPLGLIVALLAWIGYWIRQRRREQALDQP